MNFTIIAVATASLLGLAAPAMAQQTSPSPDGVYVNLGWDQDYTHGASVGGVTGRVGGRFARYFGVEGELNVGLTSNGYTFDSGQPTQNAVNAKQTLGGAAYAVGFLPLSSNFDVLGRVGYGASNYRITPTGFAQYTAKENGVRYGVGAQYLMNGANGLRIDYTREVMNSVTDAGGFFPGATANVYSVALVHKF